MLPDIALYIILLLEILGYVDVKIIIATFLNQSATCNILQDCKNVVTDLTIPLGPHRFNDQIRTDLFTFFGTLGFHFDQKLNVFSAPLAYPVAASYSIGARLVRHGHKSPRIELSYNQGPILQSNII